MTLTLHNLLDDNVNNNDVVHKIYINDNTKSTSQESQDTTHTQMKVICLQFESVFIKGALDFSNLFTEFTNLIGPKNFKYKSTFTQL